MSAEVMKMAASLIEKNDDGEEEELDEHFHLSDWSPDKDLRGNIDEPLPAKCVFVSHPNEPVQMNLADSSLPPMTVPSFFYSAAKEYPKEIALVFKYDQCWQRMTYEAYYTMAIKAAHSFIAIGLKPHESVAFSCSNSPMLFIAMMGCIFAGGIFTDFFIRPFTLLGMYILQDCKASVVIVDTFRRLYEVLDCWNDLPNLKAVILANMNQRRMACGHKIIMWNDFIAKGDSVPATKVAHRLTMQAPNKCCAIFYSGDRIAGQMKPHGVMMSQDSFTYMTRMMASKVTAQCLKTGTTKYQHRIVSFLSYSWPYAVMFEIFLPMALGGTVYFADHDALKKGTLVHTLRIVRPTLFSATNRQWMLLQARVKQRIKNLGPIQHLLVTRAQKTVLRSVHKQILRGLGIRTSEKYWPRKVKKKLGLNLTKSFISFGGPLTFDTLEFFLSLDIIVCEACDSPYFVGPHAINGVDYYQFGSVGKEFASLTSEIRDDDTSVVDGRLYVSGRHMCMGLMHVTKLDIFDPDGFVDAGLTVYKDESDALIVTGTSEEVLVLQNGYIVDYHSLEQLLVDKLPIFSHAMLVGHQQEFLSVLLTIKTEVNPHTLKPSNSLTYPVRKWLEDHKIHSQKLTFLLTEEPIKFIHAIDDMISKVNIIMGHAGAWIKCWKILPEDFSVAKGEIDPRTGALNRDVIIQHYKFIIDGLYDEV